MAVVYAAAVAPQWGAERNPDVVAARDGEVQFTDHPPCCTAGAMGRYGDGDRLIEFWGLTTMAQRIGNAAGGYDVFRVQRPHVRRDATHIPVSLLMGGLSHRVLRPVGARNPNNAPRRPVDVLSSLDRAHPFVDGANAGRR